MKKILRYFGMSIVGTFFLMVIMMLASINFIIGMGDITNGAILCLVCMRLFVGIMWDGQYIDEIWDLQEGIEKLKGLYSGSQRESKNLKIQVDRIEKHLRAWPSLHEELFPKIKSRKEIL